MRCTTSLGIVLLSVALGTSGLTGVAGATERTTLSSLVSRFLNPKKSQPVEPQIEPRTPPRRGQLPRFRRPNRAPQAAIQPQQSAANIRIKRLPEPRVNSLPIPPSPPSVRQAWIHPPQRRPEPPYTTNHLLALTRNVESGVSSRRGFLPPASRSALKTTDFDPSRSAAFAPAVQPLNAVRKVNHTKEMPVPAFKSLPNAGPPVASHDERESVGNTPAEVRSPAHEEPGKTESPPLAKPMEIAQKVRLPASTLPPVFQKIRGRITAIDAKTGVVHINLSEDESLPVGTKITVVQEAASGEAIEVNLKVLNSIAGVAAAKPIDGVSLDSIAIGDKTVAWKKEMED